MNAESLVAAAGPLRADQTDPPGLLEPAADEPTRPVGTLGPIALALSGGGYRAAGFHLGTLRLLDDVGLLRDVVALSTVSGGTLFGARWVTSLLDGQAYRVFAAEFGAFLRRTNVVRDALDGLVSTRGGDGSPSLIRSAARVYAAPGFLGDRRMAEVLDSPTLPLDEVIFNSTEFHSGVDFRFRRSGNPAAVVGNGNFHVPRAVARQVRLADVAAASSCFPSVFEPFVFPQQFAWPADFPLPRVADELAASGWALDTLRDGLPLMDGGVYDNQGLGSLLLAYRREKGALPLFLASDTSPPQPELYEEPRPGPRGWLTLRGANLAAWGVFLLAVASVVAVGSTAADDPERFTLRGLLVYGVPLLFSLVVAGGMLWMRRLVGRVRTLLRRDVLVDNAWSDLRGLTVREAIRMAELRVTSLVALSSSVFMKRIRGLVYGSAFGDPRVAPRMAPVLIYSLTRRSDLFEKNPWLAPGPRLVELATRASAISTTLWLTGPQELKLLADAGRASTCFELLKFVLRDADGRLAAGDPPRVALLERLQTEWERIKEEADGA